MLNGNSSMIIDIHEHTPHCGAQNQSTRNEYEPHCVREPLLALWLFRPTLHKYARTEEPLVATCPINCNADAHRSVLFKLAADLGSDDNEKRNFFQALAEFLLVIMRRSSWSR